MSTIELELDPHPAPLSDDELARLPVFPLPRVVFFPHTTLPLFLFEPRYRRMIEDCLDHGPRAMAVSLAQLDDHQNPGFHAVAGVGRFVAHHANPDGTHHLVLHGMIRARLEELPAGDLPYRLARATPIAESPPNAADRAATTLLLNMATQIAGFVRLQHPEFELGLDVNAPPTELCDVIADRFVAEAEARQAVLEELDLSRRLDRVTDALGELLAMLSTNDTPS